MCWCSVVIYSVCQRLVACRWFPQGTPVSSTNKTDGHDIWWFPQGTPVSSTNKTDGHDIIKIMLKVAYSPNPNHVLCVLRFSTFVFHSIMNSEYIWLIAVNICILSI